MRRRRLARAAAVAVVLGCAILPAGPARADVAAENAIRTWVAAIDASPDWSASAGMVTLGASGSTMIIGLTVRSEPQGVEMSFKTVALDGYAPGSGGGFSASRITVDGGSLSIGPFRVALSDVEINGLAVPAMPGAAWNPAKPFTSVIRALAPLAGVAMTNGRVGSAVVTETNNGVASRITYNQFRIDRWAGGKIAGVTAGPLTTESPYPDTLLTMQAGSVEAHDIDLDAALRVLDPDRYAGGLGDGVWHQVTRLAAYHDVSAEIPGVKLTLRLVSAENVRLRQPPHSFADTLDAAMAAPSPAAGDVAPASASTDMLSAYALGRFGISGLDVTASGLAGIHLGGFSATDLAADHIGDLAINDFAASVEDQGAIRIGGLALGDIVLPDLGAAASAMLGSGAGVDSNPLDLVPRIGSVNASAIDIAATGLPRTKLAKLRLDLGGHVGPVPTSIAADVQGLVFPVALLPGGAQAALHQLGYDQLDLACQAKVTWNASDETLTVDDLNVTLKDAGALSLSAELRGLPRQAIADPLALADAVPGLSLNKAAVTLEDDSIVGKGIDMVAARMHAPPAAFRQKFADVMPLVLSLYTLGNPKIAALVNQTGVLARLAPAVKALVASPGSSLTVTLAPPTPVTFPAIASTAQDAPKTLIDMLGFSVASSAAAKAGGPAAPASPPAR